MQRKIAMLCNQGFSADEILLDIVQNHDQLPELPLAENDEHDADPHADAALDGEVDHEAQLAG
jgi:hypothetical protein